MANKSLLERLETDAKRHRAPQLDILPSWVKTTEKVAVISQPVVALDSEKEKPKKSEKKAKKKKK